MVTSNPGLYMLRMLVRVAAPASYLMEHPIILLGSIRSQDIKSIVVYAQTAFSASSIFGSLWNRGF
jgi:hypothetical protein